jgi:hypothetical protein
MLAIGRTRYPEVRGNSLPAARLVAGNVAGMGKTIRDLVRSIRLAERDDSELPSMPASPGTPMLALARTAVRARGGTALD